MATKTKLVRVPGTTNNITKGIINYLNVRKNCFAFRVNNGGVWDPVRGTFRRAARAGISDIVACVNGEYLSIEVKNKATGDKMSEAQIVFSGEVVRAKGRYMVANDYETFVAHFEMIYNA
jgi:hypothetical protein